MWEDNRTTENNVMEAAYCCVTQTGPTVLKLRPQTNTVSPGSLLETQIFRLYSRSTQSEDGVLELSSTSPSDDTYAQLE